MENVCWNLIAAVVSNTGPDKKLTGRQFADAVQVEAKRLSVPLKKEEVLDTIRTMVDAGVLNFEKGGLLGNDYYWLNPESGMKGSKDAAYSIDVRKAPTPQAGKNDDAFPFSPDEIVVLRAFGTGRPDRGMGQKELEHECDKLSNHQLRTALRELYERGYLLRGGSKGLILINPGRFEEIRAVLLRLKK